MTRFKLFSALLSLVSLFFITTTRIQALSSGEILSAVNSTRLGNGLASLNVSGRLQSAAAMKLADIQQYHYWAHNNPQTGAIWSSFIRKTGYRGVVGENLASNFGSADAVMGGWLNSPTHRANLLSGAYREVGIAVGEANLGQGTETVVVAEFGVGSQKILRASR